MSLMVFVRFSSSSAFAIPAFPVAFRPYQAAFEKNYHRAAERSHHARDNPCHIWIIKHLSSSHHPHRKKPQPLTATILPYLVLLVA